MKIAILVYANQEVGFGHWYRSIALANHAKQKEHLVWLIGNKMARGYDYFQTREDFPDDLYHILHQVKPDVLVMDLQNKVPEHIYDIIDGTNTKTVVLNGVGYRNEDERADATIVQGYPDAPPTQANTFYGPEYVILRQSIFNMKWTPLTSWFVWGGARNKLDILDRFHKSMKDESAMIIATNFAKNVPEPNTNHQVYIPEDEGIFPLMSISKRACIAMGMVAWELAVLGVPIYAFSWSEGHLRFAKTMQENGLLLAWDGIGLPPNEKIVGFLSRDFIPTGKRPDSKGVDRVLSIMEQL